MPSKHRGWVFTLNNYTDEDVLALSNIDCYWLVAGREIGENGTPHLQGCVEFNNPRTLKGIKKLQPFPRAHLEPRKGSAWEAYTYCRKEDSNPIEVHPESFPTEQERPGRRSDLERVKELVNDKAVPLDRIWDEAKSYQAFQMAVKGIALKRKPEVRPGVIVHWYHGPPGSGKSYTARKEAGPDAYYYKMFKSSVEAFEGYIGQERVVFDDFRSSWMTFQRLLDLLGEEPVTVGNKGGSFPWAAKEIWITSIFSPLTIYKKSKEDIIQLLRRLTPEYIKEFKPQDNPVYNDKYDWIAAYLHENEVPAQAGDEYSVAMERYRPSYDD